MAHSESSRFPLLGIGALPRVSSKMLTTLQIPALAVAIFGGAGILMQIIPPSAASEVSLLRYATEATFTSALIVAVVVLWRSNAAFVKMLINERQEHVTAVEKLMVEIRSTQAEVVELRRTHNGGRRT
jgi:hypothetical protein